MSQIVLKKENNPQYNNKTKSKILLLNDNNIQKKGRIFLRELFAEYGDIFTSKGRTRVYLHFLEYGAATVRELSGRKKGSTSHTHRLVNELIDMGHVLPYCKVKSGAKLGSRPATIYGLPDTTDKEIRDATSRYMRSMSHIYVFVDRLYQRTLYEVHNEEIQYRKIVNLSRNAGGRGFHFLDVAKEIAYRMSNEGIKVLNYAE